MDYLEQLLRFLSQLYLQQGSIQARSFLNDGHSLTADVVFSGHEVKLLISHSVLGRFTFFPTQTVWEPPGRIAVTEAGVDNQAGLNFLRSGLLPKLSWLVRSLQAFSARDRELATALKALSGVENQSTVFLFPGLSWFNAQFGPIDFPGLTLPRVTAYLALRSVGLDLAGSNLALEVLLLNASAQGDLQIALGGASQLQLQSPQFDLVAEVIINLGTGTATMQLREANFKAVAGKASVSVDGVTPPSQLTLANVAARLTGLTVQTKTGVTTVVGGPVTLSVAAATLGPQTLLNGTVTLTSPANLLDLAVSFHIDRAGANQILRGQIEVPVVQFAADIDLPGMTLAGWTGTLFLRQGEFGPSHRTVSFGTLAASAERIELAVGNHANERLVLLPGSTAVVMECDGSYDQVDTNPTSSRLHLHQFQVTAGEGELRLVLDSVNGGDPARLLALSLAAAAGQTSNMIDVFVQDFVSLTGAISQTTAKRFEARIRRAATSSPVDSLTVEESYLLSDASFERMRADSGTGQPRVPEAVISKFEVQLKGKKYATTDKILADLRERLTPDEVTANGATIAGEADHFATNLRQATLVLTDTSFAGSYLETSPGQSRLHGLVTSGVGQLSFDRIEGLNIETVSNLSGMMPITAGDVYEVDGLRLNLPEGKLVPSSAGITQKFDKADVDLGGTMIRILASPDAQQNLLRLTAQSEAPYREVRTGQLRVRHAKLKSSVDFQYRFTSAVRATLLLEGLPSDVADKLNDIIDTLFQHRGDMETALHDRLTQPEFDTYAAAIIDRSGGVDLSQIQIDIRIDKSTPTLPQRLVALIQQRMVRLAISLELLQRTLYEGGTTDVDIRDAGITILKELYRFATGGDPDDAIFEVLRAVFRNPMTELGDALLSGLADVTGFGVDGVGIRIERHPVTVQIEGPPHSTHRRIAVSCRFQLPTIRAYATFKWRVPKLGIPPWEDRQSTEVSPPLDLNFALKLIFRLSFRLDAVTHSVEITDVDVVLVPDAAPIVELAFASAERLFFGNAMFPFDEIKQEILTEVNQQLRIPLPDNWDIGLARVEFDPDGKQLSVSVEASENRWNSL